MSSSPSRTADPRVAAEQVAMLFRMGPHALALSALGASTVTALFFHVAASAPLVAWLAVVALAIGARALLVRAYNRAQPPAEEALRWSRYYSCGAFASGLVWGMLGTPLLPV